MRKGDASKQEPLPSWGPSVPGVPARLHPHHAGLYVQPGRTQCEFGPPSRGRKPHLQNHQIKTFCPAVSPRGCQNPLSPLFTGCVHLMFLKILSRCHPKTSVTGPLAPPLESEDSQID